MSLQIYLIGERSSDFFVMLVKGDEKSILAVLSMTVTLANICLWRKLQLLVLFIWSSRDSAFEKGRIEEGRYCLLFNKLILFRSEAMGYNI